MCPVICPPPAISFLFASYGGYYACGFTPGETLYITLPLYHMSGGVLAAGQTVLFGIPALLRKKFSATNFWTDCARNNCTVVIPIPLNPQRVRLFSPPYLAYAT